MSSSRGGGAAWHCVVWRRVWRDRFSLEGETERPTAGASSTGPRLACRRWRGSAARKTPSGPSELRPAVPGQVPYEPVRARPHRAISDMA